MAEIPTEILDFQNEFKTTYEKHLLQVPSLRKTLNLVLSKEKQLLPYTANLGHTLRTNIEFNIYALADINKSLVTLLEERNFCSVEALSRVSIETAVNLIYVQGDKEGSRAKSLALHYLEKATQKAKSWRDFSKTKNDSALIKSAQNKIDFLDFWKRKFAESGIFNGIKPWPSIRQRFSAVGAEELYVTIFSASSDAIHGFPDDIFTSTTFNFFPKETRKGQFETYLIEKKSFAIFLATYAIGLHIEAFRSIAQHFDLGDLEQDLLSLGKTINAILESHENDHKKMKIQ